MISDDFSESRARRTLTAGGRILRALRMDGPLTGALAAVITIGFLVVYSASGQNINVMEHHIANLGVAVTAMVVIARFASPQYLRLFAPIAYVIGIVLLIIVDFTGHVGKGAQRWLDIAFIRFQPSEIMKLAVPMVCAWYMHERPQPPAVKDLLILGLLIVIPTALIAKQPDLGTALLIASSGLIVVLLVALALQLLVGLLQLHVGEQAAHRLGEGALAVELVLELGNVLQHLLGEIAAPGIDHGLGGLRDSLASHRLAHHQAQHLGQVGLFARRDAGVALHPALLLERRLQVLLHAGHLLGAERLAARLLDGVEDVACHRRFRAFARMHLGIVVPELQRDGVGAPQQEMVAYTIQQLGRATGVGLCVGAALDFLSGRAERAPVWMRRAGLEWLHRLASEPKRMWKRYLVDGPKVFSLFAAWRAASASASAA